MSGSFTITVDSRGCCTSCGQTPTPTGCACTPTPCDSECPDWMSAYCIFYLGSPVKLDNTTTINKNDRLTSIIVAMAAKIRDLESRLLALETP